MTTLNLQKHSICGQKGEETYTTVIKYHTVQGTCSEFHTENLIIKNS